MPPDEAGIDYRLLMEAPAGRAVGLRGPLVPAGQAS
jgi:hypothetical protein